MRSKVRLNKALLNTRIVGVTERVFWNRTQENTACCLRGKTADFARHDLPTFTLVLT